MPILRPLRGDFIAYIATHGLTKKWAKTVALFTVNPRHPSLHTELLEPRQERVYSFRLDRKHRALFIVHHDASIEVIAITKHYR